mmetsp:Transcript_66749/g.159643  ORF Transcript_66749/g.159643 Transcript_66749/m.159643 type:complete len:338 (+) Transcript_66749:1029-2042(+)
MPASSRTRTQNARNSCQVMLLSLSESITANSCAILAAFSTSDRLLLRTMKNCATSGFSSKAWRSSGTSTSPSPLLSQASNSMRNLCSASSESSPGGRNDATNSLFRKSVPAGLYFSRAPATTMPAYPEAKPTALADASGPSASTSNGSAAMVPLTTPSLSIKPLVYSSTLSTSTTSAGGRPPMKKPNPPKLATRPTMNPRRPHCSASVLKGIHALGSPAVGSSVALACAGGLLSISPPFARCGQPPRKLVRPRPQVRGGPTTKAGSPPVSCDCHQDRVALNRDEVPRLLFSGTAPMSRMTKSNARAQAYEPALHLLTRFCFFWAEGMRGVTGKYRRD